MITRCSEKVVEKGGVEALLARGGLIARGNLIASCGLAEPKNVAGKRWRRRHLCVGG